MNKVRCIADHNADFSLEWDDSFEGSVSASKLLNGIVIMKYSSVPHFLYILSKPLDNFDFLSEKQRREILACKKVSFADQDYEEIAKHVEGEAEYFGGIWTGTFKNRKTGEEKAINNEVLKTLRESSDISLLMETLKSKGIDHKTLEYAGVVPISSEYPRPVHVLTSQENETYISQYWQGMNVLKTKEEQTKGIISDTVKLYGVVVSGALRSLLERQTRV
jgi:hypothetical protein